MPLRTMTATKGCPRCGGNIYHSCDVYGQIEACVQCGHELNGHKPGDPIPVHTEANDRFFSRYQEVNITIHGEALDPDPRFAWGSKPKPIKRELNILYTTIAYAAWRLERKACKYTNGYGPGDTIAIPIIIVACDGRPIEWEYFRSSLKRSGHADGSNRARRTRKMLNTIPDEFKKATGLPLFNFLAYKREAVKDSQTL